MKFRKPAARIEPSGKGFNAGRPRVADWLKEWLANQGKWMLLDCGCRDAWDTRSMTVIHLFGPRETQIWCERCHKFVLWKNWTTFNEYMNIPPAVNSPEPLF